MIYYKKVRNTKIFNTNNKFILWKEFLNNKKVNIIIKIDYIYKNFSDDKR